MRLKLRFPPFLYISPNMACMSNSDRPPRNKFSSPSKFFVLNKSFSCQSFKPLFIGFVIVPVMCILFKLKLPPLQNSFLGIITKLNSPPHRNTHMSILLRSQVLKYNFFFKTHFNETPASLLVIGRHMMTIHSHRLNVTKSSH